MGGEKRIRTDCFDLCSMSTDPLTQGSPAHVFVRVFPGSFYYFSLFARISSARETSLLQKRTKLFCLSLKRFLNPRHSRGGMYTKNGMPVISVGHAVSLNISIYYYVPEIMISMISLFVSRIPSLPILPMPRIVFSIPSITIPSPAEKLSFSLNI